MRNYFFYIALFLTVLITVGSLISTKNGIDVKVHYFDKIIHMSAYFLLALSWLLGSVKKTEKLKYAITVAFSVVFYGIIIEVLQSAITSGRQADIYDVVANLIGVFGALLVFREVFVKNIYEKNNIFAKVVLKLLN